ncbi:MAG: hypothetical protein R6X12_09210 [bacterium]
MAAWFLLATLAAALSGSGDARGAAGPAPVKELDRAEAVTRPAAGRRADVEPGSGRVEFAAGTVDTTAVSAFGAAADERGRIWLAIAGRDAWLRVLRSEDLGSSWEQLFTFPTGTDVPRVEVVTGPGDSGCVFVFYLTVARAGDLRALRIGPGESLEVLDFEVAVGPDTITAFSVAADRDRHYYLYLLYANETRAGNNASFTRSLDYGKSWEIPQSWWNCLDPCVVYGSGSTVHCAWRYAANGREIHVETNRWHGRPRNWWGHARVSRAAQSVGEPTVAQLDTCNDARGATWVAWTVADRSGRRRNIEYARSDDGGGGWTYVGPPADEPFLDRWAPVLAAAPGRPYGPVQLGYVAGRIGADTTDTMPGRTGLRWRTTTHADRASWSAASGVGTGPFASGPGVKPRLVIPPGAPKGWPLAVYSRRSPTGARGVYASAPWPGGSEDGPVADRGRGSARAVLAGRTLRLEPVPDGPVRIELFDASGRRAGRTAVVAGGAAELESDPPAGTLFARVTGWPATVTLRVFVAR